jgi:hypothetical protein
MTVRQEPLPRLGIEVFPNADLDRLVIPSVVSVGVGTVSPQQPMKSSD